MKELERLVGHLSGDNLVELAATEAVLQVGGFRASKPEILRTRVRQVACGGAEVSPAFRRMLAGRSQGAAMLRLLPLEVIALNRPAFIALLGGHAFTVALLLDARAEVRAKGEEWLATPVAECPVEEALAQLREIFAPLTNVLGASATAGVPVAQGVWREQKEQLELRIRELTEHNRRLKGVDDRLVGVKRQLAASEEQAAAAKRRAEEAERALRQKNAAFEELAAELKRETAQREERLLVAVDLALAREFHGWLAQARTVEAEARGGATASDLLTRAEAALAHQHEIDRHSGNRAKLAQRLETLVAAHGRVLSALRNALRQSSELKTVERELAAETERLRKILGDAPDGDPLACALTDRIHAAHDNDLPKLRALPDSLASVGLLSGNALARVRDAFQKRLAAIDALGVPPDPETEQRQGPVSVLGRALAGQMPVILLVDGHNVLFGLPTRYNPPRGGAISETQKRNRLIADIVRVMAPNPSSRAYIVFDGATRTDKPAAPNVHLTYSGGTGEHRADGVLLDNIRFIKSDSPEMTVLLVSNDADLCKSAVRLGAQTVPVLELGAFF
ncbi:MAG: hypothetical protein FWG50_11325 [Kiritimatiellaeota bacterium]|nr:hypothetical protein [Kiritimatiellota bacterium]